MLRSFTTCIQKLCLIWTTAMVIICRVCRFKLNALTLPCCGRLNLAVWHFFLLLQKRLQR